MAAEDEHELSDEEIEAMLDALEEGVRRAKARQEGIVEGCEMVALHLGVFIVDPLPFETGSIADKDAKVRRSGTNRSALRLISGEFTLLARMIQDCLLGLSTLLRDNTLALAPLPLSRTIFECAIKASALIEPAATPEERVQRALSQRLARQTNELRVDELLGRGRAAARKRQDRTIKLAARWGFSATTLDHASAYVGARPKSIGATARRLIGSDDLAGVLWKRSADWSHGGLYPDLAAWLDLFDYSDGTTDVPTWWHMQHTIQAPISLQVLADTHKAYTRSDEDIHVGAPLLFGLWAVTANLRTEEATT